ncbi:hypothetical protein AAY473_031452 [Plecturocebus cupreus]
MLSTHSVSGTILSSEHDVMSLNAQKSPKLKKKLPHHYYRQVPIVKTVLLTDTLLPVLPVNGSFAEQPLAWKEGENFDLYSYLISEQKSRGKMGSAENFFIFGGMIKPELTILHTESFPAHCNLYLPGSSNSSASASQVDAPPTSERRKRASPAPLPAPLPHTHPGLQILAELLEQEPLPGSRQRAGLANLCDVCVLLLEAVLQSSLQEDTGMQAAHLQRLQSRLLKVLQKSKAGTTGMYHHTQLSFVYFVEMAFHHVAQTGLKLLGSSDLPASASQSSGSSAYKRAALAKLPSLFGIVFLTLKTKL